MAASFVLSVAYGSFGEDAFFDIHSSRKATLQSKTVRSVQSCDDRSSSRSGRIHCTSSTPHTIAI